METFTKDTLFNDLPQAVKQKIINIRNLSFPTNKTTNCIAIKDFGYVSIPSSKNLTDTFLEIISGHNEMAKGIDATENLKNQANEMSDFINLYNTSKNETDFVAEIDKTIGKMESRFEKIAKEGNLI